MVVGEFTESVDLLVVGAGPGGYVAAIRAAQLGRQVTVVEREQVGGICLNVGCIPSKALITVADEFYSLHDAGQRGIVAGQAHVEMSAVQNFKQGVVERLTGGVAQLLKAHGVTVVRGDARFVDPHRVRVVSEYESRKFEFRHAIIATGSRPRTLDVLPVDDQVVFGSTGLLACGRIPEHLVVVGGGYIGVELGTAFRKFGSRVTIVEATANLLMGIDPALVRVIRRRLQELGIEVELHSIIKQAEIDTQGAQLEVETGGTVRTVRADSVLVTVGRIPNTDGLDLGAAQVSVDDRGMIMVDEHLRTKNPDVAAIGDVTPGPMLAHKASYQGKIAAESLCGQSSAADALAIPAVIFTDPEIASVGLTPEQARAQGSDVVVGRFPFSANGRALSMGEPAGEAIVVADRTSGIIMGVHLAGKDASNLIAEGALALEMGSTLDDLALTIHAHPTLSEAIMEAAEAALGRPIHQIVRQHV
ncbi:MAG: dihydrolipoyl dehydrogenase [Sulfobacillus acidophilus]|uniref:Dihydrolipoyl dehydrogenase n=1 Tax=Sulfobacillus acidophilus TaxID=53633 RepID=A0A2T2WKX0_9FIRM|nr:MAG: dihydrolipoyl dehydrogenase [Sulfobacillus acidophilus]